MQFRSSWQYYWVDFICIAVLMYILWCFDLPEISFIIALLSFLYLLVKRYRLLYTVTGVFIESREGLIARHSVEITTPDVRALSIRQGIVGRLLNYGTVEVESAADSGVKVVFIGVSDPYAIRDYIRELRGHGGANNE